MTAVWPGGSWRGNALSILSCCASPGCAAAPSEAKQTAAMRTNGRIPECIDVRAASYTQHSGPIATVRIAPAVTLVIGRAELIACFGGQLPIPKPQLPTEARFGSWELEIGC